MAKLNIKEVEGICYPILPEHAERIFTKNSIVFPKMSVHESLPKYVSNNNKFLFYVSHACKEIVGEGVIKDIKLMNLNELDECKGLFLTKNELVRYIGARTTKKMIIFFIDHIKKYKKPVKISKCINMGGKYISKKEYSHFHII